MIALKKPANGVPAIEVDKVIGRTVKRDFEADEFITYSDLGE